MKLGDFTMSQESLLDEEKIISVCKGHSFKEKSLHDKVHLVCEAIVSQILAIQKPVFLLPSLVRLFESLHKKDDLKILNFSYFEFWLNQFSGLSSEKNYEIRGKIAGKLVPRDHYQVYFPIGQNKSYFGSHIVTAHSSPDLDTTVASFWGWIDAFAARVADGLHEWNVPGGAPSYQVEFKLIFDDIFSPYLFPCCAKHRGALQVSSLELLTQRGMLKCPYTESSLSLDLEKNSQSVVLVDEKGYYQGDWRTADVEGVRQVVMLVNQMLRHFENHFQQELIALFSKEDLKKSDLKPFIASMLQMKLEDAEPFKDLSDRQRKHVEDYLKQVLNVSEGLQATIKDMAKGFADIKMTSFETFVKLVQGQLIETLFDKSGELIASRTQLFQTLDQIIQALDEAIHFARRYVDQLKISLDIKTKVFGYKPQHVQEKADVEELRSKMGNSSYLTVTAMDDKGHVPIGVIYASDLYRPILGTVTLRDFSNRDETKVPSYLEVISCVDHHKSHLSNTVPATMYITDAQSSNTKVAELAFMVNDRSSTGGMTKTEILKQLDEIDLKEASASEKRIYRRLILKLEALDKRGHSFIDPVREYVEYHHFLFAILDDTDLLSKVSYNDVIVVKHLINRMKSLLLKKEVEVVHFDDLTEGPEFVQAAALRLLKNSDLQSVTEKIYKNKEAFIDEIIEKAAKKGDTLFFADTKEQNGCVRVGQFKLYPVNYSGLKKHRDALQKAFIDESRKVSQRKPEVDLHLFMVSTLTGLEGTIEHKDSKTVHHDEIWLFIPKNQDAGMTHLRSFCNNFGASTGAQKSVKKVRIQGKNEFFEDLVATTLEPLLKVPVELEKGDNENPLIILEVTPGSMNSRKAMITPFLPKLVV